MRRTALLGLCLALGSGCLVPVGPPPDGGGAGQDGGGAVPLDGGLPAWDGGTGAAITAPSETWTFVAFPDSKCANGTPTGVAVNLSARSNRLLLYLQGGGACWDVGTCFVLNSASHLGDTMGETPVLNEARALPYLFDRTRADNPFKDASFVYVPYCTGDLHAGTRANVYEALGQQRTLHHVGGLNVDAYLRRLVPTFASADRVWLAGASAGGYGATLNWWRVQSAFGAVRVDVLSDSGIPVDTTGDGRFGLMKAAWGLRLPPGCTACEAGFSGWLPHYVGLMPPPARYALLAFRQDNVIRAYFGLDLPTFEARFDALRAGMGPGQRAWVQDSTQHVVLGQNPIPVLDGGVAATAWVQAFAADAPDAGWAHAGP